MELVAVLPALLVAVLVAAQIAVSGYGLWSAAVAARAGARAAVVSRDASQAARRALPGSLREGAEVSEDAGVTVRVEIPRLISLMPRVGLSARSGLGGEGG